MKMNKLLSSKALVIGTQCTKNLSSSQWMRIFSAPFVGSKHANVGINIKDMNLYTSAKQHRCLHSFINVYKHFPGYRSSQHIGQGILCPTSVLCGCHSSVSGLPNRVKVSQTSSPATQTSLRKLSFELPKPENPGKFYGILGVVGCILAALWIKRKFEDWELVLAVDEHHRRVKQDALEWRLAEEKRIEEDRKKYAHVPLIHIDKIEKSVMNPFCKDSPKKPHPVCKTCPPEPITPCPDPCKPQVKKCSRGKNTGCGGPDLKRRPNFLSTSGDADSDENSGSPRSHHSQAIKSPCGNSFTPPPSKCKKEEPTCPKPKDYDASDDSAFL